jgi:ATP-dependent helicase HrpB
VGIEHLERKGRAAEEVFLDACAAALERDDGHVLAFLPGAEEIRRAQRELSRRAGGCEVMPLHGSLAFDEQRRAIAPSPRRKLILATNIAETSLTIDGVTTVVDSGLSRHVEYDPRRGLERLSLGRISKASATQRAGRAGRTAPGHCYRCWSNREHAELAEFDRPELLRVDLAPTLLMLATWGVGEVSRFGFFERPEESSVTTAQTLLTRLEAVDRTGNRATDLGKRMALLPVHPRLARLLVDAVDSGRLDEGVEIAAILSERDFRLKDRTVRYRDRGPTEVASSDLLPRIELLQHAERRGFHPSLQDDGIDPVAARQVARTRDELRSRAKSLPRSREPQRQSASDLVLAAYPDRVCVRRGSDPSAGLMVGGIGVTLEPESAVRSGELFLALDAREDDRNDRRQASVPLAHAVTRDDLQRVFPSAFSRLSTCVYDPAKDKVVGRVRLSYLDLALDERDDGRIEDDAAAEALTEALLPTLQERLDRDEAATSLLARLRLVAEHVPADWPTGPWDRYREELKLTLRGKRRLADFDAAGFLRSLLVWPLDRKLDELVPEKWEVPTGNRIRIDYTVSPPVLAVRLQEMFGVRQTPSVCGGRVPLVLHLLSPGYKPVQVTRDLVSFWSTTYGQVRKDLRARYPKHAWPEDPWTAEPVAKGRPSK